MMSNSLSFSPLEPRVSGKAREKESMNYFPPASFNIVFVLLLFIRKN